MAEQTKKPVSAAKVFLWVLGVAILFAMFGTCAGGGGTSSPNVRVTQSDRVSVSLQIKGAGDLTYTNASGNTEQQDGKTSKPGEWAQVVTFSAERGEFLYISIQNAHETGGVECRILVDGTVIESARSDGAYVIATCSGAA